MGTKTPWHDANTALHNEMRVRMGTVPDRIPDPVLDAGGLALGPDSFVFTTDSQVRFFYRRGHGIVASIPDLAAGDDFQLFLWGTVFGAVAWLNGFFVLHASAVTCGGRAAAFTGDSGHGKSTLAAGLAERGWQHLCDDTLALLPGGGAAWAMPDRKPLKLWADAFDLVAAEKVSDIASMPGKAFARAHASANLACPLTDLFVLAEGPEVRINPVRGAAKLDAVVAAMYRAFIPAALGGRDAFRRDLVSLANGLRIWRLERPRSTNRDHFDRVTAEIAAVISTPEATG